MDASAAAAIDREAAAELARERATMANEDARSYLAQRHFVGSLQVPRDDTPMTWQAAYDWRHQHWLEAVAAMRVAAIANRARDAAGGARHQPAASGIRALQRQWTPARRRVAEQDKKQRRDTSQQREQPK